MPDTQREYLTKQKYDELAGELKELKGVKRKGSCRSARLCARTRRSFENAEYHEARAQQADVEERIVKLESILKNSTVVEDRHGDHAMIGSTVTVEKKDGTKRTFMIVGSAESDMANAKISNRSPLGAAVLGKKKGETFLFTSPSGKMEYKVIDVT